MTRGLQHYYLDELSGGAGSNSGASFAVFRGGRTQGGGRGAPGEIRLHAIDWIKRGRPVAIAVALPDEEENDDEP